MRTAICSLAISMSLATGAAWAQNSASDAVSRPAASAACPGNLEPLRVALGQPEAPLFRFPELRHSPELVSYLGTRNVGIFSTDIDSFDFKTRKPEQVIASVMTKLKKAGKGIVLLHDFQHPTSLALP